MMDRAGETRIANLVGLAIYQLNNRHSIANPKPWQRAALYEAGLNQKPLAAAISAGYENGW